MPQITSIETQVKNPKRFNVFIDGKFALGADEDLIVNYRLIKSKEISSEDLEKLLFEAEVGKLMDRIYNLLSVRIRSEKEIRDYLKNLSFKRKINDRDEISEQVVDLLIERLIGKDLINDLQFAQEWVTSRRNSKKKGVRAVKMELMQKGIDREIIEQVLSEQVTEDSELELAKQALQRKLNSWNNLPPLEFKKKVYGLLFRKGFSASIIEEVIKTTVHLND